MKAKWITLPAMLLMTGVLAMQPASAEQEPGYESDKGKHHPGKMIEETDKNGDGIMSKEEFLAVQMQRFDEMDADGDGNVTEEEIAARHQSMREQMTERREAMREQKEAERFKEMDTDGDGVLSQEEMAAHHDAMEAKRKERKGDHGDRDRRRDSMMEEKTAEED